MFSSAALAVGGSASTAEAASGSIYIKIVSAGFIFGVTGGKGVLTFQGASYPLRVDGINAGLVAGVASTEMIGSVSHMSNPGQIAGLYSNIGASAAIAGGVSFQRLANSNGVLLKLRGRQVGFMIAVDLSGMNIRLV